MAVHSCQVHMEIYKPELEKWADKGGPPNFNPRLALCFICYHEKIQDSRSDSKALRGGGSAAREKRKASQVGEETAKGHRQGAVLAMI